MSDEVRKEGFKVAEVNCDGISVFVQDANEASIIWDKVVLNLNASEPSLETLTTIVYQRVDVGSQNIKWSGLYQYDQEPFHGTIRLNNTLGETNVGAYWYAVTGIEDPKYWLSVYESNIVKVIYDRVKIVDYGVSSNSVNVNQPVIVWCKAVYEYDGEKFDGSKGAISINDEPSTWSSSNQRWELQAASSEAKIKSFKVTGIQDTKYHLQIFVDGNSAISVEWKQAGIPGYTYTPVFLGFVAVLILMMRRRKTAESPTEMKAVDN